MVPCIVCKKSLEQVFVDSERNQPSGGTSFQSPGHYGSGVYDPMENDECIEINVCDECLTIAGKEGSVILVKTERIQPVITLTRWNSNS